MSVAQSDSIRLAQTASRGQSLRPVTLGVHNQTLDVPSELIRHLDALTTSRWVAGPADADGRRHVERQLESLLPDACAVASRLACGISTRNIRPNAGLTRIVQYLLQRAGYRAVVPRCDRPRPLPPQSQRSPVPSALGGDHAFLDFVEQYDHGLVRYGSGPVSRARLVAQVITAWPNARLIVATASFDEAERFRRLLLELGIRSSLVTGKSCPDRPRRVVVSTFAGLGHTQLEANKFDFLFFANAVHSLGENAQRALLMADSRFRLFAFLQDDHNLSPAEKDWVTATFSLDTIKIPRHGSTLITPELLWTPCRHKVAGSVDTLEVLRQGVWTASRRNTGIAEAARNLVDASSDRRRPDQTIVLVDGIEHAVSMARRLPGWRIVTDPEINCIELPDDERNILSERCTGTTGGDRLIATTSGASSVLMPATANATTAVLWAGSGPRRPALPDRWLTVSPERPRRLVLIDVDDRGPGLLARWTRRRRREYRHAEWFAAGSCREEEQVKAFLAARPRPRGEAGHE